VTAPSIYAFGESAPYTDELSIARQSHVKVEGPTSPSYSMETLRRHVELLACGEINKHRWMYGERSKQTKVTLDNIHSKERYSPVARARRWCWFFLYRHPFIRGLSSVRLGKMYKRDHTTILYGINQVDHSLKACPDAQEAHCLRTISKGIEPFFGAFDIDKAAGA